ncbi:MAG: hypothetical protein Q9183_006151, partial [Haloplaca sp. 2 TL-2023]
SEDHDHYRGASGLGYISGHGQYQSECGIYSFDITDDNPAFPPGEDALNPKGGIIQPECFTEAEQFLEQSRLDEAINNYCDNDGEEFFKGDKQTSHQIGTSPKTHIFSDGTDISYDVTSWYKYDDVC